MIIPVFESICDSIQWKFQSGGFVLSMKIDSNPMSIGRYFPGRWENQRFCKGVKITAKKRYGEVNNLTPFFSIGMS